MVHADGPLTISLLATTESWVAELIPGARPIGANLTEPLNIVASVVRSNVRVLYCKVLVPTGRH